MTDLTINFSDWFCWYAGAMYGFLIAYTDQPFYCGMMFPVTIPAGATITAAHLLLHSGDTGGYDGTARIYGVDTPTPVKPTTHTEAFALAKTTAYVALSIPLQVAGDWYQTADITDIIEELLASYDYSTERTIAFVIDTPSAPYWYHYFLYGNAADLQLHITYTLGGRKVQVMFV